MDKNISLIKKLFDINFSPLTCDVKYKKSKDKYYIAINELAFRTYNPQTYKSIIKFESCNLELDGDINFYDPFDKFIPNISEKIFITTKRKEHKLDKSEINSPIYFIFEEKRYEGFSIYSSGVTYSNYYYVLTT